MRPSFLRKIFMLPVHVALKLCKPYQAIEESEVSLLRAAIFHTLINTCVEIFIEQKYFFASSA